MDIMNKGGIIRLAWIKNFIKYALIFNFCFCFQIITLAQRNSTEEYLLQQEQIKRTMITQQLDSGIYFQEVGDYVTADKKFKYVLNNLKSVPSDLVFYFGKNSFLLDQYKQSVDWLNKYIQLKGTNGQFSEEAVQWLKKAEAALLEERAKQKQEAVQVLSSSSYEIDCGPTGKVICPVCRGAHVIIKKGAFGDEYKTCPYCTEHGLLSCEEYNMLLRGELKPKF